MYIPSLRSSGIPGLLSFISRSGFGYTRLFDVDLKHDCFPAQADLHGSAPERALVTPRRHRARSAGSAKPAQ